MQLRIILITLTETFESEKLMEKPELWKPGKCALSEKEVGAKVMSITERYPTLSLESATGAVRIFVNNATKEVEATIHLLLMKE